MIILITGATGFVGEYLVHFFFKNYPDLQKIIISSRNPKKAYKIFKKFDDNINVTENVKNISAVEKIDIIINLAGEPIADKKWSKKQKNILINSRIETIKNIEELVEKLRHKPKLIISASAVGFYGSSLNNKKMDEDDYEVSEDFSHELCKKIEDQVSESFDNEKQRICIVRFGVILGKNYGALKKMLPPFKLGLGGKIASGKQMMSWIHIHDAIHAINFLIENEELSGVFNLTSPNAISNEVFAKTLSKTLKRPALLDMPEFMINILFGEMGKTLLSQGQNIYPKKLLDSGFKFKYPKIDLALANILK